MNIRWFEPPTRKNIWNCDEGRLQMVVSDLRAKCPVLDQVFIWATFLKRGIMKWMAVRSDLIKYKYVLKDQIKELEAKRKLLGYRSGYDRGRIRTLMDCRAALRAMCHSDRWRAPRDDAMAQNFLKLYTGGAEVQNAKTG